MNQNEQTISSRSSLAGDMVVDAKTHYGELTPELVRQVTEHVYWLFLRDLRIERERMAPLDRTSAQRRR